jgi:hypothetical protein
VRWLEDGEEHGASQGSEENPLLVVAESEAPRASKLTGLKTSRISSTTSANVQQETYSAVTSEPTCSRPAGAQLTRAERLQIANEEIKRIRAQYSVDKQPCIRQSPDLCGEGTGTGNSKAQTAPPRHAVRELMARARGVPAAAPTKQISKEATKLKSLQRKVQR